MQSQQDKTWMYAAITVFVVIGILCAIQVVALLPDWGDKKAEWVSALGTIAAFFGTLWVAGIETMRRRREELMRARLQAVAMKARIAYVNSLIGSFRDNARDIFRINTVEMTLNFCRFIDDEVKVADLWTIEDAALVIPLNNSIAGLLARDLGEIQRLARLCRASIENGLAIDIVRKKFEGAITLILDRTKKSLEVILAECKRAEYELNLDIDENNAD